MFKFARLYVEPMNAVLVDAARHDQQGRVKFEHEDWSTPTLQEQRAIIYAANGALEELKELLDALQQGSES